MADQAVRPGDLILVRGADLMSKCIEGVTRSPYSHVAGFVKPNELIEAQGFRKTGTVGLDSYQGYSDLYTCDSLTDVQRQKIANYIHSKVDTGYDYLLIGWELDHYLLHVDCSYNEHGRHDCSTLWMDAYRAAGVDPCPGIQFPVPGDVAKSTLFRKVGAV